MPPILLVCYMRSLTERKCLDIRNRLYPVSERVTAVYERSILEQGGPGRVLLEVGCGRQAEWLQRFTPRYGMCVGIDLEIDPAAARSGGCQLIRADGHHIPLPDGCVDVVISQDVVEHLIDPVAAFRECVRVLRPGGRMIVLTVNKYFPPVLLGRALPHRVRQWINRLASGTPEEDTFPAYYKANSRARLAGAARMAGLRVLSCNYLTHHPRYFMLCVPLYRLAVSIERRVHHWSCAQPLLHYMHAVFERPASAAPAGLRPQRLEPANVG